MQGGNKMLRNKKSHTNYETENENEKVNEKNHLHVVNDQSEENVAPIVVPTFKDKEEKKLNFLQKRKLKAEEKKKALEKVEKKEKLLRQSPSLLPFLQCHEEYILLKNGVMEIFQIQSKDLYSRNDEDLRYLILGEARFYRSYFDSIKTIAMNFPSNTEKQKQYWMKKRDSTDDPVRLQFIHRKLFELEYLEKERTNREFFLFIYAENEQQIIERRKQVIRDMQQVFPLQELSIEKKKNVLFVLNNQNTKV